MKSSLVAAGAVVLCLSAGVAAAKDAIACRGDGALAGSARTAENAPSVETAPRQAVDASDGAFSSHARNGVDQRALRGAFATLTASSARGEDARSAPRSKRRIAEPGADRARLRDAAVERWLDIRPFMRARNTPSPRRRPHN